ncbi:FusB/FusC family EF-G-binding protein [Paenibacillus humicola]|uniref:FusB/FusC family EF-G-binding protein n=1 Tax=Paenibacillus humicola TaxID=3110540 RepID=UPI00237A81BF|nr:FusB/FusC family EF-G-binding protein [Paenibacillus humicola]
MTQPFIRNHQWNVMKQQASFIQNTWRTVTDPVIGNAVAVEASLKVARLFEREPEERRRLIEPFAALKTEDEFSSFFDGLKPYIVRLPPVTEKQLQRLFPKARRLPVPDAAASQHGALTYRSWLDIATNKWYLIYELHGEAVGIEGRSTPAPKKNICTFCGGFGEVTFVSAVTRAKSSISPDYYKSVGHYICASEEACNLRITDVGSLERFIGAVLAHA